MPKRKRLLLRVLAVLLLGGGLALAGQGLIVPAKARLSVHLLDYAWAKTLKYGQETKPWPWMDSVPVARLSFPEQNKNYVVLRGVSGTVLAFAPGWHEGTALPGNGLSLISAHRDTHFTVMKDLKPGDPVNIQTGNGPTLTYIVREQFITDTPELNLPKNSFGNMLVLVTCYPLGSWSPHSSQRYITVAYETKIY